MDEGIEGTYDAVGMDWKFKGPYGTYCNILGWCKMRSVRYADCTRLSATVANVSYVSAVLVLVHISGSLTAFPGPHDWCLR